MYILKNKEIKLEIEKARNLGLIRKIKFQNYSLFSSLFTFFIPRLMFE